MTDYETFWTLYDHHITTGWRYVSFNLDMQRQNTP